MKFIIYSKNNFFSGDNIFSIHRTNPLPSIKDKTFCDQTILNRCMQLKKNKNIKTLNPNNERKEGGEGELGYRQRGSCWNIFKGVLSRAKAESMRPNRQCLLCAYDSLAWAGNSWPVSRHLNLPFSSSLNVGAPSRFSPSLFPSPVCFFPIPPSLSLSPTRCCYVTKVCLGSKCQSTHI